MCSAFVVFFLIHQVISKYFVLKRSIFKTRTVLAVGSSVNAVCHFLAVLALVYRVESSSKPTFPYRLSPVIKNYHFKMCCHLSWDRTIKPNLLGRKMSLNWTYNIIYVSLLTFKECMDLHKKIKNY